ncbi:MAG: pirin-like C-terminal cupin domain-containing protein [Bacteroidia bacterium]
MFSFHPDGESIDIQSDTNSLFLYVAGEPIEERLAMYGPFVMNNNEELQQAVYDYQAGKMGVL